MNIHRILAAGAAAAVLLTAPSALAQAASGEGEHPLDVAIALMNTDPAAAAAAFETLAAAGDAEAHNGLALILENGAPGVPADRTRALRLWRQGAAAGSDAARINLATRLLMNDATDDDAEAVVMLNLIKHEGLLKATYWPLGRAYLFGAGVERDMARGSRLMQDAVEADPANMDAQYLLARAYQNGWGIPADPTAAYRHMKIAADEGEDGRAQWHTGMMLLEGDGVAADPALARRYVLASAEQGYGEGMISMAVMLALGQGGPVDAPSARGWYQRAAEAGSAHALRGLGGMLMIGEGGPADRVTGAAYLDLAEKAGDEVAPQMRRMFSAEIAALDPARVEAVKSAWIREHGMPR